MRKLDRRGVAAFKFMTLVFVPLFMLIFVIFDLGRYAITMQSLNALADAGARAVMLSCHGVTITSGCTYSTTLVLCPRRRCRMRRRSFFSAASRRR